MTRSTSSDISYTRFCIHFVLFSSPPVTSFRAAGACICIGWSRTENNVTTGVKKTVTVMEEGGSNTDSAALSARSVCQSVTNLLLARQPRRLRSWPSQQHTHLTYTPLHFHQYHRVHFKFDRQGHTRAVSSYSWGVGNAPWCMASNCKSKVETIHSTEKYLAISLANWIYKSLSCMFNKVCLAYFVIKNRPIR